MPIYYKINQNSKYMKYINCNIFKFKLQNIKYWNNYCKSIEFQGETKSFFFNESIAVHCCLVIGEASEIFERLCKPIQLELSKNLH